MNPNRVVLVVLCTMLVSGGLGVAAGITASRIEAKHQQGAPKNAAELKAARNLVWRTWNNDASVPQAAPEVTIGLALAFLLKDDATADDRAEGLGVYGSKAAAVLSDEEKGAIYSALLAGDGQERARAVRRLVVADRTAAQLVESVLADETRVNLLLAGKPIPLE